MIPLVGFCFCCLCSLCSLSTVSFRSYAYLIQFTLPVRPVSRRPQAQFLSNSFFTVSGSCFPVFCILCNFSFLRTSHLSIVKVRASPSSGIAREGCSHPFREWLCQTLFAEAYSLLHTATKISVIPAINLWPDRDVLKCLDLLKRGGMMSLQILVGKPAQGGEWGGHWETKGRRLP